MKTENINNASDKLNTIYNKMDFIISSLLYMDNERFHFQKGDIIGLGILLSELQEEIKKVNKLLK